MAAQGDLRYFQQKGERVLGANTVCLLCPAFFLPRRQSPSWDPCGSSSLSSPSWKRKGRVAKRQMVWRQRERGRFPSLPWGRHLGPKVQPTPPSVEPVAGRRGHTWWAVPSVQTASKGGLWGWRPQSPAPRPQCVGVTFVVSRRPRATAGPQLG